MEATMTAYRLLGWQQCPRYEQVRVPRPAAGEILVEVADNGLCHSDLGMVHMPPVPGWQVPFTLGHEIAGRVAALGSEVKGFSEGDPVVVVCTSSDGTCPYCLSGHDNACVQSGAGRGFGRDSSMAPYVLVGRALELIKLECLDPRIASPITDAGTTSYSWRQARAAEGRTGLDSDRHRSRRIAPPLRARARCRDLLRGAQRAHDRSDARPDALLRCRGRARFRRERPVDRDGAGSHPLNQPLCAHRGRTRLDPQAPSVQLAAGAEVITFQGGSRSDTFAAITLAEQGKIRVDIELFTFSQAGEANGELERGELRGRAIAQPAIWA